MACINPITNLAYQVGDTGPDGGIIFSIPGQGNNNTNYYFEVAPVDVSTTQRAQVLPATLNPLTPFDCTSNINAIPGAEFGVHKEIISPSDNSQLIGDGNSNTIHLNSYPTSFSGVATSNPTNPVLDIHDLAAMLCVDYVGPNGHTDWFLPSLHEMLELASNLSPTSIFNNVANIANFYTSISHPASAFYWTSSVLAGPPGTVFDTIAAGVNVVTGNPMVMVRCSTGSVRPVRMFKCPTSFDCTFYAGSNLGAHIATNPIATGTSIGATQIANANDMAAIEANLPGNAVISSIGTCAKYGNYVYNTFVTPWTGAPNPAATQGIVKMEIDLATSSLSYVQHYTANYAIPQLIGIGWGTGLCSKSQDTLIHADGWVDPPHVPKITEIQLQAGGTIGVNSSFNIAYGLACIGDLIYRPSDNSIVIAVESFLSSQPVVRALHHYTYSGTLIDSFDLNTLPGSSSVYTMFCYDGDIYFPTTNGDIYKVTTYPLSVTLETTNNLHSFPSTYGSFDGDGATSPECCNSTGSGSKLVNPTPVPTVDTFTIRDVGNTEVDTVVDKLKIIPKLNQYSGNKKI